MATRPIRLPFVRWGTWLLIVGLIGVLIGCTRREEPPAIVEGPKPVEEDKKLTNGDVGFDPKLDAETNGKREERNAVVDEHKSVTEAVKHLSLAQRRLDASPESRTPGLR